MLGGYSTPLSVANALLYRGELIKFMESMIEDVALLNVNNTEVDFIPPVVYNEMGKCFNFDYNFVVHSLSYLHGEEGIKNDFMMTDTMDKSMITNAIFLISGILEKYYGLVRINNGKVSTAKYGGKSQITMTDKFYNVVCIKNGDNVKRFSAVPFSASVLKNMVNEDVYQSLEKVAKRDVFEQVVFGNIAFKKYLEENEVPLPIWK